MRFSSTIELNGINPFVRVSAARALRLRVGWRKPLPVRVRINGRPDEPWCINMMPSGDGEFYLYLHEVVRRASGTRVGDRVGVEIEFDESYKSGPAHPMPPWFADALTVAASAKKRWESLTPSLQKEILRYFARLKSPEAQARNLLKAMKALTGEPTRFMARDWN